MSEEAMNNYFKDKYGTSYKRLEELFDFEINRQMKLLDKLEQCEQEKQQLKDNWNKLRECLNESKHEYRLRDNKDLQTYYEVCIQQINNILDKMQEIEGDSDV